jgi:hypothetical protein
MPIPRVPAAIRSYMSAFNSVALVVTARGSVLVTPDPSGFEYAWWVRKEDAPQLLEDARERGDVEASAKRLGIVITRHEIALLRSDKALARLDALLAEAKRNGDLATFNRAYRAKRLAAAANGATFMAYTTAEKRLKRALMTAIAAGTQGQRPFALAMYQVLEQQ